MDLYDALLVSNNSGGGGGSTSNNVTQTSINDSERYRLILSNSGTDNTEVAGVYKNNKLTFDPKTSRVFIGNNSLSTGETSINGSIQLQQKNQNSETSTVLTASTGLTSDSPSFDVTLIEDTWDGVNNSLKTTIDNIVDNSLPIVTSVDNNKILSVVNGIWDKIENPSPILSGIEIPTTNLGNNNNIYIQLGYNNAIFETTVEDFSITTPVAVPIDNESYRIIVTVKESETTPSAHVSGICELTIDSNTDLTGSGASVIISDTNVGHFNKTWESDHYVLTFSSTNVFPVDDTTIQIYNSTEPVVIKNIYVKVNNEWVKDDFGKDIEVTATLEVGQTSVTLQSDAITTDSTFDIYTSIWGAEPTDVTVANGSITLTFEEQEADMNVKVKVS